MYLKFNVRKKPLAHNARLWNQNNFRNLDADHLLFADLEVDCRLVENLLERLAGFGCEKIHLVCLRSCSLVFLGLKVSVLLVINWISNRLNFMTLFLLNLLSRTYFIIIYEDCLAIALCLLPTLLFINLKIAFEILKLSNLQPML